MRCYFWMVFRRREAIYNKREKIYLWEFNKLKLNSEGVYNMVLFETLSFVIGIIYGYANPGRENRGRLLRNGLLIGIVLGIIFVGLGMLMGSGLLVLGVVSVFAAIFIEILILTVLFILGTWIGDWLERRSKAVRVAPVR